MLINATIRAPFSILLLVMESQLYVVINPDGPVGQTICKCLAKLGNSVVYLSDNEPAGFAIAADEPRVRFRYCDAQNASWVREELEWIQDCVNPICGVIVLISASTFSAGDTPFTASFFQRAARHTTHKRLKLTYVITPDHDESSPEELRVIHLDLCRQLHKLEGSNEGISVNHILLADAVRKEADDDTSNAEEASQVIHYLTSTPLNSMSNQTFYFGKNSA